MATCTPDATPTADPQPVLSGSWDAIVLFTDPVATPTPPPTIDETDNYNWSESEKDVVREAARSVAVRLAETVKREHPTWDVDVDQFPNKAFIMVYGGPVTFNKTGESYSTGCWGYTQDRDTIDVYTNSDIRDSLSESSYHWAVHELGHAFVHAVGIKSTEPSNPVKILQTAIDSDPFLGRPPDGQLWGFAGGFSDWQNSQVDTAAEVLADMYTGWVYNSWEVDDTAADGLADAGRNRKNFMDTHMSDWIEAAINNENWNK